MKRFITTILSASVFFIGLGVLVENAGARVKSDEKALSLIRAARQAIGGDSSIAGIQSLRIVGQTTQTFKVNGTDKTEQGETEIAMQLPDKLMKMIKLGHDDSAGGEQKMISRQVDVVVIGDDADGKAIITGDGQGDGSGQGGQKIILRKGDGPVKEINTADGKKIIVMQGEPGGNFEWKTEGGGNTRFRVEKEEAEAREGKMRQNELLRMTLGLLLSAPAGLDVNYTYGGESSVDGTPCNIVIADLSGSSIKLFLDRDSNLPVMMAYTGTRMPKIMTFHKEVAPPADGSKDVVMFKRMEPGMGDSAEFQVRFSDYRSVNGVQFPYRWTTNVNGAVDEIFDVTSYEVNPPNIAEKFQNSKVFIRTKKPDGQ